MNNVVTAYSYPMDVSLASSSKLPGLDFSKAFFGAYISDHMFVAHYQDGAWQRGQILPYGGLSMGPAASALNYGQAIFEGMKAFRNQYDKVTVFRPLDHHKRFNISAERMVMPQVPEELFMAGILELIRTDMQWVPEGSQGGSLYLRPVMFGTDEVVGVRPSNGYTFAVVTCPVIPLYAKPVKALAVTDYVRAAEGGVGYAKCAGNYALSMLASQVAKKKGYDAVVFLDAKEHKYLEEFGTMNAFVVIDGVVITPSLEKKTILDGITRRSLIQLMRDMGHEVQERDIAMDEIAAAAAQGKLQEAFGAGTAATVAALELIHYKDKDIVLPPYAEWQIGPAITQKMLDIRMGLVPDAYNWMWPV